MEPPSSLRKLTFGGCFNQPIAGVLWAPLLHHLSFGEYLYSSFNQPIVGIAWPDFLQELDLGVTFDQPVSDVVWPRSLRKLRFGSVSEQPFCQAGDVCDTSEAFTVERCLNSCGRPPFGT